MFETLPREAMLEIFSRLSVWSLAQSSCVCKQWCNLVNDPFLLRLHSSRPTTARNHQETLILTSWFHSKHKTSSLELMITEHDASPKPLHDQFPDKGMYHLENSCGGLSCFVRHTKVEEAAFVSNPLRGKPFLLPPSTAKACLPLFSRYGLGFDSSIEKYKIVRVYFRDFFHLANQQYQLGAEVYTMGTPGVAGSWREISSRPPPYPLHKQGVYASGALHWLVNYMFSPPNLESMVISFDLTKEEFSTVPHPEFSSNVSIWFELVDLKGYLGMVDFSMGNRIEVWKLKDYERKHWMREYRIDIPTNPPSGVPINEYIEVIGLMGEDEILLKHYGMLMAYHSKTDALRPMSTLAGGPDKESPRVHIIYTGSFVSIS